MIKQLLLIGILLSLVACSGESQKAKVKVSLGYASIGVPNFNGGFIIWAKHESGRKISVGLPPGSVDVGELELELGKWSFFAFGFDGSSPMSGPVYCEHIDPNIVAEQNALNLIVAQEKCIRPDVVPNEFKDASGSLQTVRFHSCNKLDSVVPGGNCNNTLKGSWKSFRVVVPSMGFPGADKKLVSACVSESAASTSSVLDSLIKLPIKIAGPNFYEIELFDKDDCIASEGNRKIIVDKPYNQIPDIKLHTFGGNTELFIFSPNNYQMSGPAPATDLSWVESSPTSAASVTANWTVSAAAVDQHIEFYSDNLCTSTLDIMNNIGISGSSIYSPIGDGLIYFKITTVDASNNLSDSNCSPALEIDQSVPTVSITNSAADYINSLNQTSYVISGNCSEEGQTVTISIGALNPTAICTSGVWSTTALDLSGEADGVYAVTADLIDSAGNPASQASVNLTIDTVAPTLIVTTAPDINAATAGIYAMNGTCTEDGNVNISFDGGAPVGTTCSAGNWSLSGQDVSGVVDNVSLSIDLDITDLAGNTSTVVNVIVQKDTVAPNAATALDWNGSPEYNVGTGANASWSLGGSADSVGQDVQYFSDAACSAAITAPFVFGPTDTINYNDFGADGEYYFNVRTTDAVGNFSISTCSPRIVFDNAPPSSPFFDIPNQSLYGQTGMVVNISGSSDPNFDQYYYTIDNSTPTCGPPSIAGSAANLNTGMPTGTYVDLRAIGCDLAGNASTEMSYQYIYTDPQIEPYFSTAPAWNDWVIDNTNPASGTCPGTGPCYHGGEVRKVVLDGVNNCGDLQLVDSEDAFKWECDDISTGTATFISRGFKPGKGLKNLIDVGGNAWRPINVTLTGSMVGTGSLGNAFSNTIWSNSINALPLNPGSVVNLGGTGIIYTYNTNFNNAPIVINGNKIAIVSLDNSVLTKSPSFGGTNCNTTTGNPSGSFTCFINAYGRKYLYLDVILDAYDGVVEYDNGITLGNTSHSILANVKVNGAFTEGVNLINANNLIIKNLEISNTSDILATGLNLKNANDNFFKNVKVHSTNNTGVYFNQSTNNQFHGLISAHNTDWGILMENNSSSNKLYNTLVYGTQNSFGRGIELVNGVKDNIFYDLTVADNDYGVILDDSGYNLFVNVSLVSNLLSNLMLTSTIGGPSASNTQAQNNTFINVVSFNSGIGLHSEYVGANKFINYHASNNDYNIQLDHNTPNPLNTFEGELLVGNGLIQNCWTDPGAALADFTCAYNAGGTTALINASVDYSGDLYGKTPTALPYFSIVNEWVNSGPYQLFGIDGGGFPDPSARGACIGGNCRLWDFSLKSTASYLLNYFPQPDGNSYFQHTFFGAGPVNFMAGARQLGRGDGVRVLGPPENFLCESGEDCVYNPNWASYQGDVSTLNKDPASDIFSGPFISNIKMWEYGSNGL